MDDLHAVRERDAACVAYIQPLLFFKGFQALQAYRLAHWLWGHDRKARSCLRVWLEMSTQEQLSTPAS